MKKRNESITTVGTLESGAGATVKKTTAPQIEGRATPKLAKAPPACGRRSFAGKQGHGRTLFNAFLIGACLHAVEGADLSFQEPIVLKSPNAQVNGRFGAGVAWVPDVNGDGVVDIVVGALGELGQRGRVYVFDGATQEVLTQLQPPPEYDAPGILFGAKVAGIADLNGNGSGEVIVATLPQHLLFPITDDQIRVYVFDGNSGDIIHSFPGRARSVSAVPDVNGDGLPEILVGFNDVAHLYDGATGATLKSFSSPGGGTQTFGRSVSGVADVNGNGSGDVIVSDWRANHVHLFDGTTGVFIRTMTAPPGASGDFGRSVAGLGDVNGDGRGDVVVGASSTDGRAYIFEGATGELRHTLSIPLGESTTQFGWVVKGVPDITADGIPEVVVGGFNAGNVSSVYLFDGAAGSHLATLTGHADWGTGDSVAGIPDINGDGKGEVLVGNYLAPLSRFDPGAGQVLLYLSKSPPTPPSLQVVSMDDQSFTITVNAASDAGIKIEATSDFETWEHVADITPDGNPVAVEDPEASNHTRRFYRAIQKN